MAEKSEPVLHDDGQLSFVGRDCENVPVYLSASHGKLIVRLDLSFNRISSLEGIAAFGHLEELIVDNNLLDDTVVFPNMPNLHTLTLNKNKLKDLESLLDKLANHLPSLTYLSLLGNECCPDQLSSWDKDEEDYLRYRYRVLHRLPSIRFLDSTPVKREERREAIKKGNFLKVVRPTQDKVLHTSSTEEESRKSMYTPLPRDTRDGTDRRATFGKCRYIYYGRQSEGNRFIRNNDL